MGDAGRDFGRVTFVRFLYGLAVQTQSVIIGWQVYQITGDPLYLGLIGLLEAAPALSVGVFAGALIDRLNPLIVYKWVVRASLVSIALPLWGALQGEPSLALIYAAAVLTGLARGFASPSLLALVPHLIARSELKKGSAWLTTALQTGRVAGPAIAGLLYAWRGPIAPYAMGFGLLAIATITLFGVRWRPVEGAMARKREPFLGSIADGLRFVWRHDILLPVMALDMFAVFFGGATALLPMFADILEVGPAGLGLLRAAPAFGALLTSAWLIRKPVDREAGMLLFAVVAAFGFCMIGFALSTHFYLSMAFLFAAGSVDSISMVIRGTLVQLVSPDAMRGRIASINSIFIGSSNELGDFESGVAASLMGPVRAVIFGGCMTLLTVAAIAWRSPRLRRIHLSELEAAPE